MIAMMAEGLGPVLFLCSAVTATAGVAVSLGWVCAQISASRKHAALVRKFGEQVNACRAELAALQGASAQDALHRAWWVGFHAGQRQPVVRSGGERGFEPVSLTDFGD